MAIYHLSVKTISRSAGRSATAAAAYRAGVLIADTRTGEVHDYTRRSGVESADLVLPAGAPEWAADRAQLWNAAEQAEKRKNSTVAREFEIALPAELDDAQRRALALDFARELADRHGVAVDVAIHAPGGEGDSRNHHAHVLTSTRRLGGEGFGEKARELDDLKTGPALVTQWRERWAELANQALEQAGRSERIDHRTLAEQGIEREATQHLGPQATAMERQGVATRIGDANRATVIDFAEWRAQRAESAALDREAQQIEAKLIELAQERAKRTAAKIERERIERMSSKELTEEIIRVRPRPVTEVAQRDPAVLAARKVAETAHRTQQEAARAQREVQAWRKAHPWKDRAQRWGLWRWKHVEEWDAQAAKLPALDAADQKAAVAERETWMRTVARVQDEQIPATQRVMELEMRREVVAELERREAQERERQQQALAEQLDAERARRQERGKNKGPSL